MIKLSRSTPNPDLQAAIDERVARLTGYLQRGEDPPQALLSAYRIPEVKAHLVSEAHGKCAYCESKITHVYFGDVEHIRPKSVFPAERLTMANLLLACAQCNNAKGDFWDEALPLINPYNDDPSGEMFALGFLIARRPGRDRARLTIEQLSLNRQALLERRRERVELLQPLADQYALAPEGPIRDLLKQELRRQAQDDAEYAMIVRSFLRAACDIEIGAHAK